MLRKLLQWKTKKRWDFQFKIFNRDCLLHCTMSSVQQLCVLWYEGNNIVCWGDESDLKKGWNQRCFYDLIINLVSASQKVLKGTQNLWEKAALIKMPHAKSITLCQLQGTMIQVKEKCRIQNKWPMPNK